MSETYFLTGALGCIGAWTVKAILERGDGVFVYDLGDDLRRVRDLCSEDFLSRIELRRGDVTDLAALRGAVRESRARKIIHLAGLQVPFCQADPPLGARVNVLGTQNVFQVAGELGLERVVYASSAAVYGPRDRGPDGAPPDETVPCHPTTHYGVYKLANEGNARVHYETRQLSTVGLRPLTVYGVGRDQGMTSDPTRAIKAAVVGRPFRIRFQGATDFVYAPDCAAAFLACADQAPEGAHVFNLHGHSVPLSRVLSLIQEEAGAGGGAISLEGPALPLPPALDGDAVHRVIRDLPHTSLEEGIRATCAGFRRLQAEARLDTRDLEE